MYLLCALVCGALLVLFWLSSAWLSSCFDLFSRGSLQILWEMRHIDQDERKWCDYEYQDAGGSCDGMYAAYVSGKNIFYGNLT